MTTHVSSNTLSGIMSSVQHVVSLMLKPHTSSQPNIGPDFVYLFGSFLVQQKMECTRGSPTSKSVVLYKEAKTIRSAGNYFGGKC
jgi:hypothetical protein